MIFVGADGGGTGTALAAYENGTRIAAASSGPLNYRFIPPEEAVRHLTEGIAALGLPLGSAAALGIADPSLDDEAGPDDPAAERFYTLLRRFLPCPVFGRSDAYITLFGLTGGAGPGVLVIAGTGAMAIAENDRGEIRTAGGWGRLTGDEGGAWFIAEEGIRAALRASDGAAPPTVLTDALPRFFGVPTLRSLIPVFYGDPEPDLAAFAVEVDRCAGEGDEVSCRILDEAASYLAAYASGLVRWSGCGTVGIWGSVLLKNKRVQTTFEEKLRAACGPVRIAPPAIPAEEAAALYARREFDRINKENTP